MKIELKKLSFDDKQDLIEIMNKVDRNYLSDRLPNPYTTQDADWWLSMVKENDGSNGIFRAIVHDEKMVGTISVEKKEDVYRKDAEIGYLLISEACSKGIMSKAVQEICNIAFDELDICRITALVYKPNIASQKVLENNGFFLEGIKRKAVYKNDEVYDLCIYGKLSDERVA